MSQLKQFAMPDAGEGLTEAEILNWRVAAGDTVEVNQILVEVETAKAAVELPSPWSGVVTELLAEPGDTVQVGAPIVTLDVAPGAGASPEAPAAEPGKIGEEMPGGRIATLVGYGPRAGSTKRRPRKSVGAPADSSPDVADSAASKPGEGAAGSELLSESALASQPAATPAPPADADAHAGNGAGGYVPLAKPPVRKLARELGVELRALTGSGPAGVITREDVEHAAAGATAAEPTTYEPATRERRMPIRGVRKATAAAMVESAFTAPQASAFLTVDVTPMTQLRVRLQASPEFEGVKLTPLAFAAKAVCLAVRRTPDVNATWDDAAQEIVYKEYVHLGIAAATPRGLIVPKIRDADRLSLRELAEALQALTTTAREGRSTPADLSGGTITITNVGVFGVDTGVPIVNPGESAILAFGAIRDMPWVVDGAVVPRKVCQLALSFDHRVVDGQQGSQFLADVGALLADPALAVTY